MNDNGNNKKTSPQANNIMGIAAVIVVGIFVICVIVVLGKGLFTSNSTKVPDGIYTGTLSPEISQPSDDSIPDSVSDESSDSQTDDSSSLADSSDSDSSETSSSETESSSQAEGETAYITEYAYLRTEPNQDAEQIICMSPGLEVTVLEKGFDGYCKMTFMNFGTPLEGYVYEGYLSYES